MTALELSIVIPVARDEDAHLALVERIESMLPSAEIILCSSNSHPKQTVGNIRYVEAEGGRAAKLNAGCKLASFPWIWCLHADSQLNEQAIVALQDTLHQSHDGLHYFRLRFAADGPRFTALNALGANMRARLAGIPFGDQGFLFKKTLWEEVGGFPEDVSYGEDHVFVWRVKNCGFPLRAIPASIITSARKYAKNGWFATTFKHALLTWQQAAPLWWQGKMQRRRSAAAVFVKTPGLSPVKTRLAAGLGREDALDFYRLSCQAIQAVLRETKRQAGDFSVYWAVAEPGNSPQDEWKEFPLLRQGDGDLGPRLHRIYDKLIQRHGWGMLLGADAPQITPTLLKEAMKALSSHDYVIGPSRDGGFYLFLGKRPVSEEIWLATPYSASNTCEKLASQISSRGGRIAFLKELQDADTLDDLRTLRGELEGLDQKNSAQDELLRWIKKKL